MDEDENYYTELEDRAARLERLTKGSCDYLNILRARNYFSIQIMQKSDASYWFSAHILVCKHREDCRRRHLKRIAKNKNDPNKNKTVNAKIS